MQCAFQLLQQCLDLVVSLVSLASAHPGLQMHESMHASLCLGSTDSSPSTCVRKRGSLRHICVRIKTARAGLLLANLPWRFEIPSMQLYTMFASNQSIQYAPQLHSQSVNYGNTCRASTTAMTAPLSLVRGRRKKYRQGLVTGKTSLRRSAACSYTNLASQARTQMPMATKQHLCACESGLHVRLCMESACACRHHMISTRLIIVSMRHMIVCRACARSLDRRERCAHHRLV
jgi:hypothetical protein